ncbi:Crp/Fnr family transcriptional regulator [Actinoplanes sp. NPDC048796]|uniref:Crp/Fnr family transcriptional regulator n=1 Tax=Actinoplanes sp. NPDC048796 TaxID=3155640 RepID=UPI0033D54D9F
MADRFPRRTGWPPGTFLGGLTPAAAGELLGLSARHRYQGGRPILREGALGSHVVVLESGFVKVTTADFATLLGLRLPGELIGEIGPLTGSPRSATVTACGTVHAGVVTKDAFEEFLRRHPAASTLVMAMIARQLSWANRRRSDFAVYPAPVRLARLLAEIAETCGRDRPDGGVEITVPLSHPELAAMIAVSRATVQNAVQELRAAGLIATAYRRIVVLDQAALAAIGFGPSSIEPGPSGPDA